MTVPASPPAPPAVPGRRRGIGCIRERLLDQRAQPVLETLRHHNPILFDFVLKRTLPSRGHRLSSTVFETRRHFHRSIA